MLAVVFAISLLRVATADAGFIAETRDPSGDSTSALPAHDLLGAGIGFDRKSGYMVGVVALRAAPGSDTAAFVSVYAGTRSAGGCSNVPAAGFAAFTDTWSASWFRQDSASKIRHGEADRSGYRSNIQKFEIRDRRLAGKKWDCLGAVLTDPEDPSIIHDRIPIAFFKGLPSLGVKVPAVRRAIPPNRVRKVRIVVRNPGDGPLRNLRIRIQRSRGLKVSPWFKKVPLIRPHSRRVVTLRVRLFRSAGRKTKLRVRLRSGKLKARAGTTLRLKLPKKKPAPGGGNGGSGVCVQYFPDLSGETGGSLGLVPC